MAKDSKYRVISAVIIAALLLIVLISACNILGIGGGEPPPGQPSKSRIITPANNIKVVVGGPVQVQSAHAGSDVARVELRVKGPTDETARLITADRPSNGFARQQWNPDQIGLFTVEVVAFNSNNEPSDPLAIQVEVIDSTVVSAAPVEIEQAVSEPADEGVVFQPPTATPAPTIIAPETPQAAADAVIAVAVTPEIMAPTPTPVRIFPPPPPAPGVPHGPLQEQLPELMPPVCDAAQYLGPFVPNTSQRIMITEPDPVPAKTAGGAQVHRAWRLQNIGTCTWGPGYELAFYGGRSMGSGGVAFGSFFPTEPDRKNTIQNPDRLIVPEGIPNQVAVLEVILNAPSTPGIHQSYWRMRNPQGVYFGPIIGVTLETVRVCEFNIYGAPVINKFEILGVGNVYNPVDPVNVVAEVGDPVILEWSIINADSYDIIVADPVGNTTNLATNNTTDRNSFIPITVGEYNITLYADNGPCTASATVIVNAVPPEDEQFNLIIITSGAVSAARADASLRTSPSVSSGNIVAEWAHFDKNADQFILYSSLFERKTTENCYSFLGLEQCFSSQGEWEIVGDPIKTQVGGAGDAAGAAMVTNVESQLCSRLSSIAVDYQLRYVMQAGKDGKPAEPEWSNAVIDSSRPCDSLVPLKDEIPAQ